jgi:hypothetical protein
MTIRLIVMELGRFMRFARNQERRLRVSSIIALRKEWGTFSVSLNLCRLAESNHA